METEISYTVDAQNDTAFLINSDGYDVAYLARLQPKPDAIGFCCPEDQMLNDAEWQRLINLVADAPRLLALVKEYRQESRKLGWGCDSLDAAASKAIEELDRFVPNTNDE